MENLENIATLDDEIQAQRVDAVLTERGIPHILQTYRDSAYDGVFQMQKGWGAILAPPEHRREILIVLADLAQGSGLPGED